MTAEQLIYCLKNNQLADEEKQALELLLKEHPYMAVGNLLLGFKDEALLSKANVYKSNPFLFNYNKNLLQQPKTTSTIKQKLESSDFINKEEEFVLQPLFTEDYFKHQGIAVKEEEVVDFVANNKNRIETKQQPVEAEQQVLVTMSFNDWLLHFKKIKEKEEKEQESKQALRAMWQKQKLTLAAEEENEMVPESVFTRAINSINMPDNAISEVYADILANQGKKERAIEMYRKLSLINPEKNSYFASKIKNLEI